MMGQPSIPWNIIGPARALVIVILLLVFGFILKYQARKGSNACVPKDLNTVNKKTLCFKHEGDIASNKTAIEMIGGQLEKTQKQNREDHGKIFQKIEDLGKDIIREINKT